MRYFSRLAPLGLLGVSVLAFSSVQAAEPTSPKPVERAAGSAASHPSDGGSGRSASGRASSSGGDKSSERTSDKSDPKDKGEAKEGAPAKPTGPMAGYTWSDKPAAKSGHARRFRVDPKRPIAASPEFRLLEDGSGKLTVLVSRSVTVSETKQGHRVVYRLRGAQVALVNNTNPLSTGHFPTPLLDARLIRVKTDVLLVLTLRDNVTVTSASSKGPEQTMLFEVSVPKASHAYEAPAIPAAPASGGATTDATSDAAPPAAPRRTGTGTTLGGEPGPKL